MLYQVQSEIPPAAALDIKIYRRHNLLGLSDEPQPSTLLPAGENRGDEFMAGLVGGWSSWD
eukprot:2505494-Alexandrium_andersonii.AAC.1